ncbi:hypothetical protein [Haloquadratum walsbyi]|uniref:Uncharacterized protein n=1 Tax=Haloquadratum walsbyi J07HQW2 TaxID=1238425 RepID=U1N1K1_9EURY|nr:hypothetical protein [Haloquadratum walsbyi]ERG96734.1 MAG: hypothetical protein J07HQW2_03217 [Haloquadratum walsbyi J07HQW2]
MSQSKRLATLDTAATGISAVISAGAFTSVTTERAVELSVASDADLFIIFNLLKTKSPSSRSQLR